MRISLREPEHKPTKRRRHRVQRGSYRTLPSALEQIHPQDSQRARRGATPSRPSRAQARPRTEQPPIVAPVRIPNVRLKPGILARWWVLPILGALIGAIIYVSVDAGFYVYKAQIVGAQHLDARTIYQTACVDQQNIFWVQPRKVAERIIQLDGIKVARVRCSLPSAVRIEVDEREPVIMWRSLAQAREWWVDEEGLVLPYHGDAQSDKAIFVVDSSSQQLKVGDRLQPDGIVAEVRQLAAALPGTRVFYYQPDRGLSYIQAASSGKWPVYVGTTEDLPRKVQVVDALNQYLRTHNIHPSYVDVRWASRPTLGVPSGNNGGSD